MKKQDRQDITRICALFVFAGLLGAAIFWWWNLVH